MAGCEFMNERKGRAFPHTTRRRPVLLVSLPSDHYGSIKIKEQSAQVVDLFVVVRKGQLRQENPRPIRPTR